MRSFRTAVAFTVLSGAILGIACGGSEPANRSSSNSNNANINAPTPVAIDAANLPPEFSTQHNVPVNAAGIPSNNGPVHNGSAPTPGIPGAEELKKTKKAGATPTPGIPSPDEIRRMMANPANVHSSPPGNSEMPMMKSKRGVPKPTP